MLSLFICYFLISVVFLCIVAGLLTMTYDILHDRVIYDTRQVVNTYAKSLLFFCSIFKIYCLFFGRKLRFYVFFGIFVYKKIIHMTCIKVINLKKI